MKAPLPRRRGSHAWGLLAVAVVLLLGAPARGLDRVRFATNWRAQAEHGGFYQALADGTYERYGLEVEIRQGGPMVNNRALLALGRVDFLMGSNLIQAFDDAKQGLPSITVAGVFQKDVHCLLSTPGAGNDTWDDLKQARLLIGNAGRQTYFRWLVSAHGFSERRVRPYTFNLAPFLANPKLVQQGYMTAEPKSILDATGHEPNVFLLADHGWSTYSTLLMTRAELAEKNPDLVQRFVDASMIGWVNYLYGDPAGAHRLIQRDNAEMPDGQLVYSRRKLIEAGVVDSGDTIELGLGALSDERIADFHRKMVAAGLYQEGDVDLSKVHTTRFVNRGVGLDLKQRLIADP